MNPTNKCYSPSTLWKPPCPSTDLFSSKALLFRRWQTRLRRPRICARPFSNPSRNIVVRTMVKALISRRFNYSTIPNLVLLFRHSEMFNRFFRIKTDRKYTTAKLTQAAPSRVKKSRIPSRGNSTRRWSNFGALTWATCAWRCKIKLIFPMKDARCLRISLRSSALS